MAVSYWNERHGRMFRAMSATTRESSPEPGEPSPIAVDAAIVGAGIAGLWIGNLLTARGFEGYAYED